MTKKDMARAIAEQTGIPLSRVQEIVRQVLEAILDALVQKGSIELRNFGVFKIKKRKARHGRNPKTGEKVLVPERFVVTFKPGREMRERIRQSEKVNQQ